MNTGFVGADFDQLAEAWNRFHPDRYRVSAAQLRLNSVECPSFDWGASTIQMLDGELVSYAIVKRAPIRHYKVVDKDAFHLSALVYDEPRRGIELMSDVKRLLRNRGGTSLAFGRDSRHFFPGCPVDFRGLCDFLMVEGFDGQGESHDLERDLTNYENPMPVPAEFRHGRLTSGDLEALDGFLAIEFPGRWRYDVTQKVAIEGPDCVYGLWEGEDLVGFALLHDENSRMPIGGAVWHLDLGEHWGSLGPIGVAESIRGRKAGGGLLGAALESLRDRGVRRCIIDWTGLVDFYGRHGFEVTRTYRTMTLGL